MDTERDTYARDRADRDRSRRTVLYIAFRGAEPLTPPSRHILTDIDVVTFGRGDAPPHRDTKDGLRRLVIRVPDSLMSTHHGQLVHVRGAWVLDDPDSKNGVLVRGERTRSATLAPDELFALGHTLFAIANESVLEGTPLDLSAAELPAPVPELATFHSSLADAYERLARIASTELPVLLLGETGTGKEVVARALHELSRRRGAFVAVNCGAITATLVESELFGHRRGAFSGATVDKLGFVRTADQGTLFLDEIGELPLAAQAALLRVLQEREVVPVGDSLPVPVDLRVCAATHRDLAALVASGAFREDLYARLLGVTITLPPLRARRHDLGILIPTLLRRLPRADRVRITPAASLELFEYSWPRNVRELERVLNVMVALAGKQPLGIEHVPEDLMLAQRESESIAVESAQLAADEQLLKEQLVTLLQAHGHNVAEVARRLGKDRTQIYRWVRRFGIERTS